MSVNVLYKTSAKATGGRDGHAATLDGALDVKLTTPKELGGAGLAGTNPEQLFAAGWSTCFLSALKVVAGKKKLQLPEGTAVDAEVDLGTNAGGYQLQARLNVAIPGVDRGTAQELADAAHQICPYSKATRGNIDAMIRVV